MPELPEVQTVVATLQPHVTGARIAAVMLRRQDIVSPTGTDLAPLLLNRTITNVTRRAKRIVFTLDDCDRFYIHLGMTGQLTVESPDAEVKNHTHLTLTLALTPSPVTPGEGRGEGSSTSTKPRQTNKGGRGSVRAAGDSVTGSSSVHLRFRDPRRFGGIFWLGGCSPDEKLGPEPLTLKPARLAKLLAKTRRPIKSALLDQTLLAGLGNIYADECLHLARIHPLTPANEIAATTIPVLNRAIKLILRRAIRAKGSTLRDFVDAGGQSGAYRARHQVYDREGHPCRRCKTPIVRIVLTGRSTCFCPKCQPR